ncbi:MAG: VOC family protein [Pigmentiphaga sp.]|uniref:VOC family protein n=1 Tax=Pigmentiphaga sp. TaxID=1977564 RepID=UPI0029B5D3A9|nr:VOC family protein [Pigmentiphaga sp.]MDX3904525.1 VOC family protein [Pigmentiphaga sp.]
MTVKRIVANIACTRPMDAQWFYGGLLGLEVVMDHGWITTFASAEKAVAQVAFASEGGNGTPVPDLSVEVDNLDEVYANMMAAGVPIEYGPASEPWGVRRFYVRDPFGRLVNILAHETLPGVGR